jgi:hypothetical protein
MGGEGVGDSQCECESVFVCGWVFVSKKCLSCERERERERRLGVGERARRQKRGSAKLKDAL